MIHVDKRKYRRHQLELLSADDLATRITTKDAQLRNKGVRALNYCLQCKRKTPWRHGEIRNVPGPKGTRHYFKSICTECGKRKCTILSRNKTGGTIDGAGIFGGLGDAVAGIGHATQSLGNGMDRAGNWIIG